MKREKNRIRRLGWAGIEIECQGETLLIDYIQDISKLGVIRSDAKPFPFSSNQGSTSVALLTHLHSDRADPGSLSSALRDGAPVLRPKAATGNQADLALTAYLESELKKYDLSTQIMSEWEERKIGPFRIFSVPAVDGFGDPQLSWIIEFGNHRVFHGGDTLFHGNWWRIAHRFEAIDIAFLPINGPIVNFPPLSPASGIEAVMTPEQAAVAAKILKAKFVVPIHFGSMHKPPLYIETANPVNRLLQELKDLGIDILLYEPGDWFDLK